MSTAVLEPEAKTKTRKPAARAEFRPGLWTKEINVRHFLLTNYTP